MPKEDYKQDSRWKALMGEFADIRRVQRDVFDAYVREDLVVLDLSGEGPSIDSR